MVRMSMKRLGSGMVILAAGLGVSACMSSPAPAPVAAAPGAPVLRPITGWLATAAGDALDAADRERAFAAQISAAETGQRASWRSAKGHFGFVEPGPEGAGLSGTCRPFTHTIYVDGKAQRGTGSACRSSAGVWDVVS
jgi:surface antigen